MSVVGVGSDLACAEFADVEVAVTGEWTGES